jgi:hypothetical protein
MKGLVAFARSWPGVEIQWYDLMDRLDQRSKFSWAAVAKLFWTAATTGIMRLPISAMPGTTMLQFDAEGKIQRQQEDLMLIGAIRGGKVQNRRVAKDTLQFMLEVRRPPGILYEQWDQRLMADVGINQVPGMGQLDIEGMDPGDQNQYIEDISTILAFGVVVVLTFGFVFGYVYLQNLQAKADMMQRLLDSGY